MTVTSREAAVDVLLSMRKGAQCLRDSSLAGTRERIAFDMVLLALDDAIRDVRRVDRRVAA